MRVKYFYPYSTYVPLTRGVPRLGDSTLYKGEDIDKVFLVSGDGDYFRMVNFLREEGRLGKVLFPSRKNASSLYRRVEARYRVYLDAEDIKKKIAYRG